MLVAIVPACRPAAPTTPPRPLRIATGPSGGTYLQLGYALANIYERELPGIRAQAETTDGSVANMRALEQGDMDLAFTQADVAYETYGKEGGVRAVAALDTGALQLITRADGPLRRIGDLAGRRVSFGPIGSGTERAADVALQGHGLGGRVHRLQLTFEEAAARVVAGELDAAFVMASVPTAVIKRTRGLRLIAVDPAVMARLRTTHPFYRPIVIAGGTYDGQTADVLALGVDNILACRAGLEEAQVQDLTRVLVESLRELAQVHPAAAIDPEDAPAVPIPLHPGAKRYYRVRELLR